MNEGHAITEVEGFRAAVFADQAAMDAVPYGYGLPANLESLKSVVVSNLDLVVEIAEAAKLHDPGRLRSWSQGNAPATDAAGELLGILNGRARRDQVLAPTGPSLDAARMHPWVWHPATARWDVGHRRDAVQR
jgi:hypothetical protein